MVHEIHATNISMYSSYLKDGILEVVTVYQYYVQVKKYYSRVMYNTNINISKWKWMEFSYIGIKFMFLIP
jgi:hypothetical protein